MRGVGLRRLLHVGSSVLLVTPIVAGWDLLRALLIGGVLIGLVVETVRIREPRVQHQLARFFPLFKSDEANRPSGAWWLCFGYAIAVWVPQPGAAAGIMVGALADPAASLIGSTARSPAGTKTVRGSAGSAAVALLVLALFGLPWTAVLGGTMVATTLERWPGLLDDNLLIAPGVASTVWLLS